MLRILAIAACGLVALAAGLAAWFVASLHPYQVGRLPEGVTQRGLLTTAAVVAALALGALAFALLSPRDPPPFPDR